MIIVKEGDVDIGESHQHSTNISPSLGPVQDTNLRVLAGGNPSAEEAEEALEAGASQINNVVHSFRLQSTAFDKKVCPSTPAPTVGRR